MERDKTKFQKFKFQQKPKKPGQMKRETDFFLALVSFGSNYSDDDQVRGRSGVDSCENVTSFDKTCPHALIVDCLSSGYLKFEAFDKKVRVFSPSLILDFWSKYKIYNFNKLNGN